VLNRCRTVLAAQLCKQTKMAAAVLHDIPSSDAKLTPAAKELPEKVCQVSAPSGQVKCMMTRCL
jgi:hypothetical protein